MTTRTRITATPLYPGSFYSEPGSGQEIPDSSPDTALAAVEDDGKYFAIDVETVTEKRWTDGEGNEIWLEEEDEESDSSYRIYKEGELLSCSDVEKLPGDNQILLTNMRGNGWDPIIRTRRGNFQPLNDGDVVL